MANVLVRGISRRSTLRFGVEPAEHGQSLQQYLAGELEKLAERPTLSEVLDRIESHRGGRVGLGQAADDLGEERGRG